jgi:hypothetical protein
MFFPMAFLPSFENNCCVRNLKLKGCKTAEEARKIIERRKVDGYVKRLGHAVPVWSNVK